MTEPSFDDPGEDLWSDLGERIAGLGEKLRRHYRGLAGDDGPTEDEIREALLTLGRAARSVVSSLESAANDPDFRQRLEELAASFASTIGKTLSALGEELRRTSDES